MEHRLLVATNTEHVGHIGFDAAQDQYSAALQSYEDAVDAASSTTSNTSGANGSAASQNSQSAA